MVLTGFPTRMLMVDLKWVSPRRSGLGRRGGGLLALRGVETRLEHEVRHVDRALALGDLALRVFLGLLEVALDHGHALDDGAVLGGADLEDLARLALVGAGDDNDEVVALDVKFLGHVREPPERAR